MPRLRLPIPTDTLGEDVSARTTFSKTYRLADGKRRLLCKPSAVHYRDAAGAFQDVDLEGMGANLRLDTAPYTLQVTRNRIGMTYTSRATGEVLTCELEAIGGVPVGQLPLVISPQRVGQDVRWDALPGLTIALRCQPSGVSWIKRLADATVPRSFTWLVTRPTGLRGVLLMSGLRGRENLPRADVPGRRRGWPLDLTKTEQVLSDDGTTVTFRVTETWTGRVKVRGALVDDPIFPVEFDPTFQEVIATNNDDGHDYGSGDYWIDGADTWSAGKYNADTFWGGVRFSSVGDGSGPASGATIDSATLTFDVVTETGTPLLDIYADNVDNAAAWSATSGPKNITETTAKADFDPVGTGSKVVTVTAIVQEIVNRAGWAQGQAMRFAIENTQPSGVNYIFVDAINDAAGAETLLDITYTAGGAAGPVAYAPNRNIQINYGGTFAG